LAEATAGSKRQSKKATATAADGIRLKSEGSDVIGKSFHLGKFDRNEISSIEIPGNIGAIPTLGVRETADTRAAAPKASLPAKLSACCDPI
jgi:hypothetical protein